MTSTETALGVITLRPANAVDGRRIYAWRNDERTRRFFRNRDPVSKDTHEDWVKAVIERADRDLIIGEVDGTPVGVLRYDHSREEAEVSVYLDPDRTGAGLGTALLRAGTEWIADRRRSVLRLTAAIHPENPGSIAAFRKAGFALNDESGEFHIYSLNVKDRIDGSVS